MFNAGEGGIANLDIPSTPTTIADILSPFQEVKMRTILIAGAVMLAGSAAAADFGLNYDAAHQILTKKIAPHLVFQECVKGVCSYTTTVPDMEISVVRGKGDLIDGFGITFKADSWAMAAAVARSIQKEFYIADKDIVSADDLARHAVNGVKNDEQSAKVVCLANKIDDEPYIYCRRK